MKVFLAGCTRLSVLILFSILSLSCSLDEESAVPRVKFSTTVGDFVVELYPDKAPSTVENFLSYVDDGFYKGTIFHRVIKDFMVQGGGFTESFNQKDTRAPIPNESTNGLQNIVGSISMARTQDPDSATAQFFINTYDNLFLDSSEDKPGYAVFGQVIEGYSVIEKIEDVATGSAYGFQDVPLDNVIVHEITRL